jgi:hypothetical protein
MDESHGVGQVRWFSVLHADYVSRRNHERVARGQRSLRKRQKGHGVGIPRNPARRGFSFQDLAEDASLSAHADIVTAQADRTPGPCSGASKSAALRAATLARPCR